MFYKRLARGGSTIAYDSQAQKPASSSPQMRTASVQTLVYYTSFPENCLGSGKSAFKRAKHKSIRKEISNLDIQTLLLILMAVIAIPEAIESGLYIYDRIMRSRPVRCKRRCS